MIYKYELAFYGETQLQLPASAQLLTAGIDPLNKPCLWVSLNPDLPKVSRIIIIVFTGEPAPTPARYISTFIYDETYVLHAFEVTP